MWSGVGEQIMVPTPGQSTRQYGIGAVNWHTGETLVLVRRHKRRSEIAQLLEAMLERHPDERVYVAWDNATTHFAGEVEDVLREANGRLVLLYLPTYSPWLNPAEMLWKAWRYHVTHCEFFETIGHLVEATYDFFGRCNHELEKVLSIIGSKQKDLCEFT
jgi:putative transposase